MKLSARLIKFLLIAALACGVTATATPPQKDKDKEKDKDHEGQRVDSGSFGVFMSGHRVGTETFSIYQSSSGSVIKSEFKTENDPNQAVQDSVMQLSNTGEIRRYEWKEMSPGKAESVIVPNDQFLNQRWTAGPQDKPHDQPYLLSPSTVILDDYFFIHRELLVWKFLAATCKQEKQVQCPIRQRAQFGTMDPHQHSSAPLSAEFLGREKLTFKGSPQEFNKIEFKTEAGSWLLWLDDNFMVMRIVIEGDNTEVIRD